MTRTPQYTVHETDLLFGIVSGMGKKHYLLADFDNEPKEEVMRRVGRVLMRKYKFGNCYLIKSGRGWHVVNFTDQLSVRKYVMILREMGCDMNYIRWIEKVKYGVLRVSRRSSHFLVPELEGIVVSPWKKKENQVLKNLYFSLLEMEQSYKFVRRVVVRRRKK